MTLDQKTIEELNRLKELKPGLSTQELIDWVLTRTLQHLDPSKKPKKKNSQTILPKKSLPQRQGPPPLRHSLSRNLKYQV